MGRGPHLCEFTTVYPYPNIFGLQKHSKSLPVLHTPRSVHAACTGGSSSCRMCRNTTRRFRNLLVNPLFWSQKEEKYNLPPFLRYSSQEHPSYISRPWENDRTGRCSLSWRPTFIDLDTVHTFFLLDVFFFHNNLE